MTDNRPLTVAEQLESVRVELRRAERAVRLSKQMVARAIEAADTSDSPKEDTREHEHNQDT
jgi:hypothetical protein